MRPCASVLLVFLFCGCVDSAKQSEAPVPKAPATKSQSQPYLNASQPGPADKDAAQEFTQTSTGLKYKLLRKTDGRKPQASDTVLCNYRGTLDDGTEFDSSYKRGKSIDFPLNRVIPGWTEGLQYCPEGGMIELEIPSALGYGPGGTSGIPGGATLHFIVELIQIL